MDFRFLTLLLLGYTLADQSADRDISPAFDHAQWKEFGPGSDDTLPEDDSVRVADTVAPSISSNLYASMLHRRKFQLKSEEKTTKIPTPIPQSVSSGKGMLFALVDGSGSVENSSLPEALSAGSIRPTRAKATSLVNGDEKSHGRIKRCMTCMGMGGDGGSGGSPNANMLNMDMSQQFDSGNSDKLLIVGNILNNGFGVQNKFGGAQNMAQQQDQVLIRLGGDQGGFLIGSGTQTIAGAMRTTISNGFAFTLSSYTRIVNGVPTIGVITLGPIQTYYEGKLLQAGQNPYGVPNQGTYTIAGAMSTYQSDGYLQTVSSYTRIVDGAATFGAITLAGMQTQYNGRLLQAGQNPFGVPKQGTFTLAGSMETSVMNGSPVTMSTYTRIVDGVATYGTVTIGSMQTYYQGKLLLPGDNIYGVPNQGTFTLPGGIATSLINGYTMTMSTYTRVVDGTATFGTVTLGTMQTFYQGKLLQQGENAYGVPNVGTFTLQGAMSTALDSNGYPMTVSTYTKIVDGTATFGTVTLGSMQTYYNGRILKAGENAYGVPNQGVYTLAGQMSQSMLNGYPMTVSTYTKVMDGVATFGTVTLGGMQTYYNGRLLQPGQNAYGVPNQGTYTIPGAMAISNLNGYPMTVSTYTKVVNGVATFGTITLGSMQTYYNGRLLQPNENAYGVPNVGTYTLPGPMSTLADVNGYPITISSYTKIIDGRATFGAVTQGMQVTYYNGKILPYGQNPFGVPNQGTYTLPGSMQTNRINGADQTMSTYTRIVNGVATYGTVTISPMQTYFIPNQAPTGMQDSSFKQLSSSMQGAFPVSSDQNAVVVDSGTRLIPDFINSAAQVPVNVQVVPIVSQSSGSRSRFSSSQNAVVVDSGTRLIPDFINSAAQVPVNVQVIPIVSQASSSNSNRFVQSMGQSQQRNQGTFIQVVDQGQQLGMDQESQGSANRFRQVLDQVNPAMQQNMDGSPGGNVHKSFQILTVNRVSGGAAGSCPFGQKKK